MYLDQPSFIIGNRDGEFTYLGSDKDNRIVYLIIWQERNGLKYINRFYIRMSTRTLLMNPTLVDLKLQSIGYIIPGLIANWFERQGFIKTMTTMIIAAVVVRITLIIISGGRYHLMYKPSLKNNWSLIALCILSIVTFYIAQYSKKDVKQDFYSEKLRQLKPQIQPLSFKR
jgi:hypothetical protein